MERVAHTDRVDVAIYCAKATGVTFIWVCNDRLPGARLPRAADINQSYYVGGAALYADVAPIAEVEIYLLYHAASCT